MTRTCSVGLVYSTQICQRRCVWRPWSSASQPVRNLHPTMRSVMFACFSVIKCRLSNKCVPQVTQVGLGSVFPSSTESGWFTHSQSGHLDCSTSLHAFISLSFSLVRSIFRVLPKWSRSPWIRSLAVRGMWWSVRGLGSRWPMKSRTCSTCSSEEVWLCAFGNAPDVASHTIATMRYLYSRTRLNYATLFDLTRVCAQMCEIVYEEKKGYRFLCTSPGDSFSVLMYSLSF